MPDVTLSGTLAGRPLDDRFQPALAFKVDPLLMQLVPGAGAGATAGPGAASGKAADPLAPTVPGTLKGFRDEPNALAVLGFRLDVGRARAIAFGGFVLALLGILGVAGLSGVAGRATEPERIRAKYGAYLLGVVGDQLPRGPNVVDVTEVDDLARLAERTGRMILHAPVGEEHEYVLQDGDVTYRFRVPESASREKSAALEPAKS